MTTTTPDTVLIETPETRRSSTRLRFAVAFLIGLIASMAIGVGALYAYDRQYVGRILPGVAVGSLDVSGLDAVAAGAAIRQVYGYLGEGSVTFKTRDSARTVTFAEIGRGPDVDAMVAEALAVGRDGNAVERFIADARTALRGVSLTPKVTFDADALAEHGLAFADSLAREPQDAWVAVVDKEFAVVPAIDGRLADPAVPVEAALADLGELSALPELTYEMPVHSVPPATTTDEATDRQDRCRADHRADPVRRQGTGPADHRRTTADLAVVRAHGRWRVRRVRRHVRSRGPAQEGGQERRSGAGQRVVHDERLADHRRDREQDRLQARPGGHEAAGPGPHRRTRRRWDDCHARAGDQGHPAAADHRGSPGCPSEDAQDLAVDDVLPDRREERLRRQHLDPRAPHQRLRRRTRGDVRLLECRRFGHAARRAIAREARSSTDAPNRRAPWPAVSARAPRPCSTPQPVPATRWAPGATTTTTSTAIRSASTRRCSSARRARSRRCHSPTTPITRC